MADLLSRIRARAGAKADSPLYRLHPELEGRVPVYREYSDEAAPKVSDGGYTGYAAYYVSHPWVHKAIKILADNLAPLPLQVVRGQGKERQVVAGHPIAVRLDSPNSEMSPEDLWREWVIVMMLGGEIGLEVVRSVNGRNILEFWPREPQTFTVRPGDLGSRYRRVALYHIDDKQGSPYDLRPDQFVHFAFKNPLSPWRGLSPIAAVKNSIVLDLFAQAWSKLFFRNSARPDYAVITEESLTSTERRELQKDIEQDYGGVNQAHKAIILDQAVRDIKPLSFPPKDLEWVEQRKMGRDEIGATMGVPDGLMGWGQESYDTATKLEGDMRALWTLTIVPLAGLRDGALTRFLRKVRALAPDERVTTDMSGVSALRDDIASKIDNANKLWNMGTPLNTAREIVSLDAPDIPGGDVGYLPFGLVPVVRAGKPVQPDANKPTGGAPAGEDMPMDDGNMDDGNADDAPAPKSGRATRGRGRYRLAKAPDYGSAEHKALWEHKDTRLDDWRKRLVTRLDKEIARQGEEALRRLRTSERGIGANGHNGHNGAVKVAALVIKTDAGDVFDPKAEARKFKVAFRPIVKGAVATAGQDELDGLGTDQDFDEAGADELAQDILDWFSEKVNDTTYSDLGRLFAQIREDGATLAEQMARLNEYFDGRRDAASLERIARTTMTSINGAADVSAWGQSGVVEQREWLAAIDDRTRADHRAAHGQQADLDTPFYVGGEYLQFPGDPQASAEQIVNCRCTEIPIVNE
ncbi:MAG: phage portal protein [Rhodospirillaceae bacterium]